MPRSPAPRSAHGAALGDAADRAPPPTPRPATTSAPHPPRRGRRPPWRPDGRAGQRAAPAAPQPAPGHPERGQGKMPSRVRALMIRTSGSAPSSCDRAARTRPYIMIDTASAQFGGHGRDLADPLGGTPGQSDPFFDLLPRRAVVPA